MLYKFSSESLSPNITFQGLIYSLCLLSTYAEGGKNFQYGHYFPNDTWAQYFIGNADLRNSVRLYIHCGMLYKITSQSLSSNITFQGLIYRLCLLSTCAETGKNFQYGHYTRDTGPTQGGDAQLPRKTYNIINRF